MLATTPPEALEEMLGDSRARGSYPHRLTASCGTRPRWTSSLGLERDCILHSGHRSLKVGLQGVVHYRSLARSEPDERGVRSLARSLVPASSLVDSGADEEAATLVHREITVSPRALRDLLKPLNDSIGVMPLPDPLNSECIEHPKGARFHLFQYRAVTQAFQRRTCQAFCPVLLALPAG